jgi:hypothetical protein
MNSTESVNRKRISDFSEVGLMVKRLLLYFIILELREGKRDLCRGYIEIWGLVNL